MKISKFKSFCSVLTVVAGLAGAGSALADEAVPTPETAQMAEMPVLKGDQWRTMTHESKVAFIWGVGHVVTIEEHVLQRHPELKRPDFVAKLAEGLRGIPMNAIIDRVDSFYRTNPDDLDLPVMRVIWRQMVKPKLTTGIADRPLPARSNLATTKAVGSGDGLEP